MAGTTRTAVVYDADGWIEHRGDTYRYLVYLSGDGASYTAVAATVPGVTASGRNPDEALGGLQTALAELIRARKAAGEPVPRAEVPEPPNARTRWVIVRLAG